MKRIISCDSSDLSIKIWDFSTYACVRTLRGHDHTISAVKFIPSTSTIVDLVPTGDAASPGCTHLASASRDHSIKFWELETGFCVHTANDHSDWVRCLAVKQDGTILASSGNDTWINIMSTTGERKSICQLRGHEHVVESLSFIMKNKSDTKKSKTDEELNDYIVSGSRDRTVRLWSISAANCISIFSFHENWVRSVILHPSGNFIISASDDRSIKVIDVKVRRSLSIDLLQTGFVSISLIIINS